MSTKRRTTIRQFDLDLLKRVAEGDALKRTPIPPGHVRFERNDYSYGQQGQVTRIGYTCKDVPDYEAINWIAYGCSTIQWPDGQLESFDMRVSPVEHSYHLGYGKLVYKDGREATGTLSRLPNVFVEYYGIKLITEAERKTFKMIINSWGELTEVEVAELVK